MQKNVLAKRTGRMTQATATVIDAGARYGMHPTWQRFLADLKYYAFEADPKEAARLQKLSQRAEVEVIACALGAKPGIRNLHMTKHRGCSSFLKPDLNSDWFKLYRPGEGAIEKVIRVKIDTVDHFAFSRKVNIDFLKVDTEGTELEVLRGANHQIASTILGVRVQVNFQAAHKGQALFPEIHTYLLSKGFFLANLDYFGRGVPRNSLFRNPDPTSLDHERYGVLIATDGVWLKAYDKVCRHYTVNDALGLATLKYAYFCMLNNVPDIAIDTLMEFVTARHGSFSPDIASTKLYCTLRRACAEFLGRYRVVPDEQWETARSMFRVIFGLDLESGSKYWEFIQSL